MPAKSGCRGRLAKPARPAMRVGGLLGGPAEMTLLFVVQSSGAGDRETKLRIAHDAGELMAVRVEKNAALRRGAAAGKFKQAHAGTGRAVGCVAGGPQQASRGERSAFVERYGNGHLGGWKHQAGPAGDQRDEGGMKR